jgi:hypothetical protein
MVQAMLGCEVRFEIFPSFLQDVIFFSFFACVAINACVKYEGVRDVNYLLFLLRLLSCLRIGSSILHLSEQIFNRATGVISLTHPFIIGH